MREFDPGRLIYESTQPGSGGNGPRVLKPFELLDVLAPLVPPPRLHRDGYFAAFASLVMGLVVAWLYCYVLSFDTTAVTIDANGPGYAYGNSAYANNSNDGSALPPRAPIWT